MRTLVFLFFWSPGADSRAEDRWFGPDKVQHFAMSFFVQSATYAALRTTTGHSAALAGASVATAAVGVSKELRDRRATHFSTRDLVWDGAGALAASVLLAQTGR